MFLFVLFLTFLSPSISNAKPPVFPKIIGGRPASQGELPYQLSLWDLDEDSQICGASLVVTPDGTQFAITAGHCLVNPDTFELRDNLGIGGGSIYLSKPLQWKTVIHSVVYPEYFIESGTPQLDIALVFFDTNFILDEFIGPIDLPQYGEAYVPEYLIISGWGKTRQNSASSSEILQVVDVPTVPLDKCAELYTRKFGNRQVIFPWSICAGVVGVGGKDACQGDSGGPAVGWEQNVEYPVLAGITSWGDLCGSPLYPGVYTSVDYFLPWILENVQGFKRFSNKKSK